MNIQQTLKWIEKWYDLRICHKTLYNWIHHGRKGAKWRGNRKRRLKNYKICGQLVLKKQWVINFMEEMIR